MACRAVITLAPREASNLLRLGSLALRMPIWQTALGSINPDKLASCTQVPWL